VQVTAGTIGCLIALDNNKLCLLSNNHVLANVNNANIGDPIIQPGTLDGGRMPGDRIGVLERFVRIDFNGTNHVDAAAAWTAASLVKPGHVTYALNPSPLNPALHMSVLKNGRTTQATTGIVTDVNADNVRVGYGSRVALFDDQILIQGTGGRAFSLGGDSGSLIVTAGSRQPVALLFAGPRDGSFTIASPIAAVMRELGIKRFIGG